MVQRINFSRLNKRLSLCGVGNKETAQHTNKPVLTPINTIWCGLYTLTMNQKVTLLGTPDSFDLIVIVRHQAKGLNGAKYAVLDKKSYQITDYNPDSENIADAYDLISLKRDDKIGLS